MKRRSSAAVTQACVPPSVKRTKVQAQRKFAQNNYSYSGSRVVAKTPEEYKAPAVTIPISSPENEECELNTFSSLPTVDDLLTFLCFRGTDVLPAKLNYLSSPQFDPPPPPPQQKKYSKTNDDGMLPSNSISINLVTDKRNKLANKNETSYRSSKRLDECKKLRSRYLINKSIRPTISRISENFALQKSSDTSGLDHSKEQSVKVKSAKSQVVTKRCSRRASEILESKNTNEKSPKSSNYPIAGNLSSRRASEILESKNSSEQSSISSSCHITAKRVLPKASEIPKLEGLNNQPSKLSTSQFTAKSVTRRSSEILNPKNSNEQSSKSSTNKITAKIVTRRVSEILELKNSNEKLAKSSSHVKAKLVSRKTSKILEPKNSNEQSSIPPSCHITAKRVVQKASEIPKPDGLNDQPSKLSTSQITAKSVSRRSSEILDLKNSNEQSLKSSTNKITAKIVTRRGSEILDVKSSNEQAVKPTSRRASEILEVKHSNEQSAKSSTSQIIAKPVLRRGCEVLIKNSTEQSAKSSTNEVITQSTSLEPSVILDAKNCCEQMKSSSSELQPKQAMRRPSDVLELEKSKECESKAIISKKLEPNEMKKINLVEGIEPQENTSPTTIEVTIKDLTKRQKPEKSVFKKKVLSVKTNATNMSKDNHSRQIGTQIRDLTETSTVEVIKMTAQESPEKDDCESSVANAAKTNINDRKLIRNKASVVSSSTQADVTGARSDTSQSLIEDAKMANLGEKKIFRKSDVELNRKSEAFSPDNEKSVYAFEPDLPTTSPPFRRLKPATPPKMLSVNNSVAVQVNFGKDVKVECSSTGDTRVSSTTDSEGDRVFYIPIQTSAATSTLGVAVKLGTDGPNQKIFMSATLITNSPVFTTNTVTNVQAKSGDAESICMLTDTINSSNREQPVKLTSSPEISASVNEQLKNKKVPKSSPVKVQSVKILKLNRNKKVDQGTNVDLMNSRFRSTSICKNKKVERRANMDLMKTKSELALVNQSKKTEVITQAAKELELSLKHQNKKVEMNNQSTSKYELTATNQKKEVEAIIHPRTVETSEAKLEPILPNKSKKVEIIDLTANMKHESRVKSKKEDKEKLPMSEVLTKKFNSVLASPKLDSVTRTTSFQRNDIASNPNSTSSASYSTLSRNSLQSKSSVKIVKVNKTKKIESSDNSSGTDSPIPVTTQTHNIDVAIKKNLVEGKLAKAEVPETKSKPTKVNTRHHKCKNTESSSSTLAKTSKSSGEILDAPTFRPSKEEFNDPLEYIESIRPVAEKFGLCRIVPPPDFRPECKVADEMRFTAYNQYIHKMLHRWGPNVKEMLAIKKFLATQNIQLTQAPWIGGMEVDLPRLYQTVQQCGGLSAVIESGRWQAVADMMRIPKLAQDRITKLDDIYCKYLLPYDILSHEERERIFDDIEKEWAAHLKKSSDDELFEDVDECVLKGRTMPLSCFYRIARNTMMMCFGSQTDGKQGPSTETIEREFWNHVSNRKAHICVHSGSIDSGTHGYGFSVAKNSTFRKHPWNLKVLTNNAASILRFLGPLMGVTVPTLHVGMLYSAFCWYRDPHGLPWIEYLHTGADKIWYGIPDEHSEQFREAMLVLAPRFCRDKKIWLSSDTVMIPPPLLIAEGVSLSRVVQQPGQFIVVFPKAFTSSISTGYLVSESVYFAQASWLDSAKQIFTDMRDSCEPSVFSLEQLLISIAEDTRPNVSILTKILPLLSEISEVESSLRVQLRKRGVNTFERLNTNKKRKSKSSFHEEEYYECDVCHTNLFVSTVANSYKQNFYCLQHAVTMLQKKSTQAKHCKLLFAYTEEELTELVDRVKSRIEAKSAKK